MQTLLFPLIFSLSLVGCWSGHEEAPVEHILHGTIAYPFVPERPLGWNGPEEKFVIRSRVGNSEYAIEIPRAGRDYDIEIPLAHMEATALGGLDRPKGLSQPTPTDRELLQNLPSLPQDGQTAKLDSAFGVAYPSGPGQPPSYTLGLAKIRKLYGERAFEYALIEINNLIEFFPNSPKLHKMKGTVLLKLGNLELAEKAWSQSLELEPTDRAVSRGLAQLRKRMDPRGNHQETDSSGVLSH